MTPLKQQISVFSILHVILALTSEVMLATGVMKVSQVCEHVLCASGYQKLCKKGVLFEISKKVILDIQNNKFGYPKINIYFGYQKLLFWMSEIVFRISEIVISDIQDNYSGYQKLCQKSFLFEISKKVILDIQNNNFGYPKINIYFGYQKLLFWKSESGRLVLAVAYCTVFL